jgi:hypothetical protein
MSAFRQLFLPKFVRLRTIPKITGALGNGLDAVRVRGNRMPGDTNECRKQAECCFEMARASTKPDVQASLNDIGHHWMRLAAELDSMHPLLNALDDSLTDQPRVVPYRKAG